MLPRIALQVVPASAEDAMALSARHLLPDELALLSPRATAKRLAEFVAGRVAARTAVGKLLGCSRHNPRFRVLREGNGPTGCPKVVTSNAEPAAYVSISHADGLAIAAAAHRKIGIDLATIEDHAQSFLDATFSPRELNSWGAWLQSEPTSPLAVTAAFAAKEAALKWLGTGFGVPLKRMEIVPIVAAASSSTFAPSIQMLPVTLTDQRTSGVRDLKAQFYRIGNKVVLLLVAHAHRGVKRMERAS